MVKSSAHSVSQEEAIRLFRDLALPFLNPKSARIEALLDAFFAFYRDIRIADAVLGEEGDSLMLEWGANCPHLIQGFKDFREANDDEVGFDEEEYEWIGLTRQVATSTGDPEEEFDGEAVGLCLFIYFGKAGEEDDEAGDSLSVASPQELPAKVKEFKKNAYVAKLLKHKPSKITAFVSGIG